MQPTISHNAIATPQQIQVEEVGRVIEEIRRLAEPVARALNASAACLTGSGREWLFTSDLCSCRLDPQDCSSGREREIITLLSKGSLAAQLLLCGPSRDSVEALKIFVQSTARQVDMENQETALLEELSTARKSLEAVYEISSDLRAFQSHLDLLDRIMTRATSFQEGLCASLWVERDDLLDPVAMKNAERPEPRSKHAGLMGRALADRQGIIINANERVLSVPDLEAEMRQASNLLIAPVETRQGLAILLVIWQENQGKDFDSRSMRLAEALALQAAMVIENERLDLDRYRIKGPLSHEQENLLAMMREW